MSNYEGDNKNYNPLKKLQEMVDTLPSIDASPTDRPNHQQQRHKKNEQNK